jgi:hypothetical protein
MAQTVITQKLKRQYRYYTDTSLASFEEKYNFSLLHISMAKTHISHNEKVLNISLLKEAQVNIEKYKLTTKTKHNSSNLRI